MTADQHQAEAEKWLGHAHQEVGRDSAAATAYAAIATAHAQIAAAMRSGR